MRAGEVVAGRFRVELLAGTGAMGSVFRARDLETGGLVALKVMSGTTATADRFAREANALSELVHPAVVRYVEHGTAEGGELYLAMEWLEGEDLDARLMRQGLSLSEAVGLARRVAEGLGAAHARGIVHRDIKPTNLFLSDRDVERVKVIDFGIARQYAPGHSLTMTGAVLGSPGYMSPEQARGDREVDARADVFALGCVLFQCVTGSKPFVGDDMFAILVKTVLEEAPRPSDLRPDVPEALDDLLSRMLAKSLEDRPRNAAAVANELAALGDLSGGSAPRSRASKDAITDTEQRVLCVVLARPAADEDALATTNPEWDPSRPPPGPAAAVQELGGSLDVLADGSLLVTITGAGAPTDEAMRAARCALSLKAELPGASIALSTGRGRLGRRSTTGEVVDRAAALLRRAHSADAIRVDEVTAGLLDARFEVGGDEEGLVLRSLRELADATRTLLGRPTPCVGRDRELAALEGVFAESASESVARVVLVTGPGGVGKSRLRYELLRKLKQAGATAEIWMGRGDPIGAGAAFGMVAPAIRRAAGIQPADPLAVRRQKLRARVARNLGRHPAPFAVATEGDTDRVVTFLGELCGVPHADDNDVQLRAARRDALLMGDQMRRAFVDFLAAECSAQPLLLVLEDLHWGDLPSVRFLDAALGALSEAPLMVFALGRNDLHDLFPRIWSERATQEIRLGALGRKASERLVVQMLGPEATPEVVERLVDRSGGNAFYLEELIRAVAEGKGSELPETVLAMAQARLEALEPEARRVLRAASVFGQEFWGSAARALLGAAGAPELDRWLQVLVEREVIAPRRDARFADEKEYVFRHALVREAAYAMLTDADRELGHRLAGEWLERSGESDAVALAEHFARGGERARALGWYRKAAEQALEGNDFVAASDRAELGVAQGADGEVLGALRLVQTAANLWRGDTVGSERCGLEALALLPKGSDAYLEAAGETALAAGRLGRVDRLVEMAAALGEPDAAVRQTWIVATAHTAGQLLHAGRYELADELLERAQKLAVAEDEPAVRGVLTQMLALRALVSGDPGRYLATIAEAALSFERAGDARSACVGRLNMGHGYLEVGAYAEAAACLEDVLGVSARLGLQQVRAATLNNLGMAMARQNRLDEAVRREEEAAEACRAQGNLRFEGGSHIYLAIVRMESGDREGAERDARRAVELLEASPAIQAYALAALTRALAARGATADALATARAALDLVERLGGRIEEGESLVRLVWAESLDASGQRDDARDAIVAAERRLRERADRIADPRWRASFLERVPENARTLELFRSWTAGAT